tara:strand:- start:796223 stop:796798 length:576 start_codon:yes stop_codon:yes gene_type:complete
MSRYNHLVDILVSDRVSGATLSVDESIDRTIKEMDFALEELSEGEWNGMAIKDASQMAHHYEAALKPILQASAAILNTVSQNKKGWETLSVAFEERAALGGQTTLKLQDHEANLSKAVHNWLDAVDQTPCAAEIGKPLAVNCAARGEGALNHLADVLSLTNQGWEPKAFIKDSDAQDIVAKSIIKLNGALT